MGMRTANAPPVLVRPAVAKPRLPIAATGTASAPNVPARIVSVKPPHVATVHVAMPVTVPRRGRVVQVVFVMFQVAISSAYGAVPFRWVQTPVAVQAPFAR